MSRVPLDAEFQVVVVGAGGAGMVGALVAARAGRQVLLVEKSVRRGCNTELSGGLVQGAGTRYQRQLGIEDSPQQMFDDIMRKNGRRADSGVLMAICQRSADVVHFLADVVGLEMHLDTNVRYYGHSTHRMHAPPGELGSELVAGLRRAVAAEPTILFLDETPAEGIVTGETGVIGVRLGRTHELVGAEAVLLACDGFAGSPEMLSQYCPEIAGALYIGSENNTGDSTRWGLELGAALDHMTAYQGHSHVNPKHGTRLGGSLPNLGSIMVNTRGCRFAREDQGYSEFAKVILAQPGGVAVEIFDQRIYGIAWHNGAFREAVEAAAVLRAGDSVELARLFGLPPDQLTAEIDEYNRSILTGTDRLGRKDFAEPLEPPLYGSLVTGAIAHTQGGLRIDSHCRVLRPKGSPITGLYAAGGTAAGISGDGPEGYMSGNGLIDAFATGLIAAETMIVATASSTLNA